MSKKPTINLDDLGGILSMLTPEQRAELAGLSTKAVAADQQAAMAEFEALHSTLVSACAEAVGTFVQSASRVEHPNAPAISRTVPVKVTFNVLFNEDGKPVVTAQSLNRKSRRGGSRGPRSNKPSGYWDHVKDAIAAACLDGDSCSQAFRDALATAPTPEIVESMTAVIDAGANKIGYEVHSAKKKLGLVGKD